MLTSAETTAHHVSWLLSIQHAPQISHNFAHVVVRNLGTPSSSDALSAVHQHHWYDGNVPLRFNSQVVVSQVTQQRLVLCIESMSRQRTTISNKQHLLQQLCRSGQLTIKNVRS